MADRGAVYAPANRGTILVISLGGRRVAVQSAYRHQVASLAPDRLVDRESELAELAAFCAIASSESGSADPGPNYRWYQAAEWAGKTALMAAFVLDPPPDTVVVSFFITARLAGQDTRDAFRDNLMEQLLVLLNRDESSHLESTRDAQLLQLIEDAAAACEGEGKRLVLVVDGLDEDRTRTIDPLGQSIAAALPKKTPHGLRVIVASREDPGLPDDVAWDHPLRMPGVARRLRVSEAARDIAVHARVELRRLLHGPTLHRDLVGLLAAAVGGLTVDDLAALTGADRWVVDEALRGVAGRTLPSRPSRWSSQSEGLEFLLRHEELQNQAVRALGSTGLAHFHERIHQWAGRYQQSEWPPETPEYLLRGYHRLVFSSHDQARIVSLALDDARRKRLFEASGSGFAALGELQAAQDTVSAMPAPDWDAAVQLMLRHERLAEQSDRVDEALPRVWARLGEFARAESIARSFRSSPDLLRDAPQVGAMKMLATFLAQTRRPEQALRIATSITSPLDRAEALGWVAGALTEEGHVDKALEVAGSITDPARRSEGFARVAAALGAAGLSDQAQEAATGAHRAATRITARSEQAGVLARVVDLLVEGGLTRQAQSLANLCRQFAVSKEAGVWNADLFHAIRALAKAGLVDSALEVARSISFAEMNLRVMGELAEALVSAGRSDVALEVAASIEAAAGEVTKSSTRAYALAAMVLVLGKAGRADRAQALAFDAQVVSSNVRDPFGRALCQVELSDAFAEAGLSDQAIEISTLAEAGVSELPLIAGQAMVLGRLANVFVKVGRSPEAIDIAQAVNEMGGDHELIKLAGALVHAGRPAEALCIARGLKYSGNQISALTRVAESLAEIGEHSEARRVASEAYAAASLATPGVVAQRMTWLPVALVKAGHIDEAIEVAGRIPVLMWRAYALADIAATLADSGEVVKTQQVVTRFRAAMDGVEDRLLPDQASARVAGALAKVGDVSGALEAAGSIRDFTARIEALTSVAGALVSVGYFKEGIAVAKASASAAAKIEYAEGRAVTLARLSCTLGMCGEADQAHELATAAATAFSRAENPRALPHELALALVRSGQMDRALETCSSLDLVGDAQATVVAALTQGGLVDDALQVARSIYASPSYAAAMCIVAMALIDNGRNEEASSVIDRARNSAEAIGFPMHRATALAQVAGALAKAGFTEEALALTAEVKAGTTDGYRFHTTDVHCIVETLARAGLGRPAYEVALGMASDNDRARALGLAAQELASHGAESEASDACLRGLIRCHHLEPAGLGALARVCPEALEDAATFMLRMDGSTPDEGR